MRPVDTDTTATWSREELLRRNGAVEAFSEAEIIEEVREEPARMVLMHTGFGGTRMIDMLVGDPLPRIC